MTGYTDKSSAPPAQLGGVVEMGTRGFLGVVVGGDVTLTYNHFDSYPSELGANVAQFCETMQAPG